MRVLTGGANPAPATMNDEGLADVSAASPEPSYCLARISTRRFRSRHACVP